MEWIFVIILGYFTGSLINYLSDVLPDDLQLIRPTCKNCHSPFPLIGYLLYVKCNVCQANRHFRSLSIVILVPVASALIYIFAPERLGFLISFGIFSYLLLISVIDIEHHLVLSSLTGVGLLLFLGIGVNLHGFTWTLVGGIGGFGIMYLLYGLGVLFSRWINKIRGITDSEPGMGKGDVSISGVIGLLLGWPGITAGLLLGIIIGGGISALVLALSLIKKIYHPNIGIPYVPFLAISTFILIFR